MKKKSIAAAVCAVALLGAAGAGAGVIYARQQEGRNAKQQEEALASEMNSLQDTYQSLCGEVDHDKIYEGVTAMGLDLSGMTQEEAKTALDQVFDETVLSKTILLKYGEKSWEYTYADLGFTANTEELAAKAYEVGRSGDVKQRYEALARLSSAKVDFEMTDQYDTAKLDEIITGIQGEVEQPAKDATIKLESGKFVIGDEQVGYTLDTEDCRAKLNSALDTRDSAELELKVVEVQPTRTRAELSKIQDMIGEFSTTYNSGEVDRSKNLQVGSSKIDGIVLMPGESFNYNDTVSPVNEASGYRNASTILDGEYVPGMGGGLCQVSTTLYNAVIRAELEVTERYAHSLKPSYVKLGQDAAMSIGGKNFQFKNNSSAPIYIQAYASGGKLVARIYGVEEHDPSRKVSFETVVVKEYEKPAEKVTEDPTQPEGYRKVTHKGYTGCKVDVYKIVTQNGKTTREYFSSSSYMSTADQVTIGTAKPASTTPEPGESSEPTPPDTSEPAQNSNSDSSADSTQQ